MVEQKRTKLFLMLVQQAGPGSLPLSFLSRFQCLEFMRQAETVAANERSPIFVYWSSRSASWLLPEFTANLERRADCLAVFSEERDDKQEEFCFIVESHGLSIVIYAHHVEEYGPDVFQCVGSVDPELVRQALQMMLPMWQFLDLSETNRLEDARANATKPTTTPQLMNDVRALWRVCKPPSDFGCGQTDTGERQAFQFDTGERQAMQTATGERPAIQISTGERPAYQPIPPGGVPRAVPGAPVAKTGDHTEAEHPFTTGGVIATSERVAAPTVAPQAERAQVATTQQQKKEKASKAIRELRNREAGVWQPISEQGREVFPLEAQRIIRDIMGRLRHSSDHFSILQYAIEELTKVAHADRGLVWQQIGDQLMVTNEYSPNGHMPFKDTKLGAAESEKVISEFLARFKDETGTGVIAIPEMTQETRSRLAKTAPTLYNLMVELTDVRARVVAQLRCVGRFHGFLELQQSTTREWTEADATLLQSVAETLAIVTQQAYDLEMREMDASEMKLINMISELFRESKGQRIKDTLSRSVKLVAEHIGFVNSQVYLLNEEERLLIPQIASEEHGAPVSLDSEKNPFVQVCSTRKPRTISFELTGKRDSFFEQETALVVPLESEGETMGVVGFWKHAATGPRRFRPGDEPKLAQTVCNNLASIVRADQAIALIRADRSRSELINTVNDVIRQSPKDVDHILEELVNQLQQHFSLGLCVVSLYDANGGCFIKSKVCGDMLLPKGITGAKFAEVLFQSVLENIMQIPILEPADLKDCLQSSGMEPPKEAQLVTIVPAVHHKDLKAAICLVSVEGSHNLGVQDMNMIKALAERVAVDISHKELFERVERQAITDPMTGLYNRRHFSEQLSKEIDRNQRFGHPFSYIILDLDFLKRINDTLGHQYGDAAIRHIANVTKKCVRDVDTTARYGGEEFVVLLPETDVQGARVVAERMCYAIREVPVEGIGTVTASIGVATFPYDAQDRDKLTELADQALYLAKHRGRNQVCSVSEDLIPSLDQLGEEALEIQKAAIKAKAEELASIDLRLVAEYGLLGILGGVMKLIEAKDQYANDRSPRAADYAAKLAQSLHLSKDHTTVISLAAILHNIGKIAISENILQKKEPLTIEERKILETSPAVGAKILEPAKHLHRVASVVESYHEHWDGTGYPRGLRGEQIPLESRIIALIDAYVAMTSDRPYRAALSTKEAAQALQAGAGKEWDPRLVKLFLSVLNKEQKQ